jgi:tetratricopeptide (TPR) repeat protein
MSSNHKSLVLANQLLRDGKFREAFAAVTAVLNADQKNADAWYVLSNIHLRTAHRDEAISCARQASEFAPERPELLIQLGTCLGASGRTSDALAVAENAARLEIRDSALLSNLGSLFSMCNNHARAVEFFSRAVEADGSSGAYWYNLASAQRMLGHLDDAAYSCEKAIALAPQDGQAFYLRSDLRIQSTDSNHIPELRDLVSAPNKESQNRILATFALAKELEDIGEYSDSFHHLNAGATAFRKTIKYDVSEDIAVIDQIIANHTQQSVDSVTAGYEGETPIFVVGLPRSGTTLVERIIQSHSDVRSVGERNDFALEMSRLAKGKCSSANPTRVEMVKNSLQIDMTDLGLAYATGVRSGLSDDKRIVDKMPINYLYCGLIHSALPNAKIVSLARSPMDSCYSAYKAFLRGPYSFTYDLDELGRYYLAFRRLTNHWRVSLPRSAYRVVDYEALVHNFESESRRLFEFLELNWEDEVLEFQKHKAASSTASAVQVRRDIYSSSVGKWKHYAKELEPLRQLLAQEIETL